MFKKGETVIVSSEILFEFGKNDITKQMKKGIVLKTDKDSCGDTKYLVEFLNGERFWIYCYDTGSGPTLSKQAEEKLSGSVLTI